MTLPARLPAPEPASAAQFARVRTLIEDRCGLHFGETRRTALNTSLRARMHELGLASLDAYYERLCDASDDTEFGALINLLTISETCFFRDPAQFQMLRRHILPSALAQSAASGRKTLRIWSAGCSSGEEAYSVALVLCEMGLPLTHGDWIFEITATDVNTGMLAAARCAVYGPRALRNVDADLLRRYFMPEEHRFKLLGDVAALVRFEHGSLTDENPQEAEGYDIVLCKNVAIYFRPEVTRRLVRRLYAALSPGGYLLLGHSESLWGMEQGFTLVEHEGVFCYRKPPLSDSSAHTDDTKRKVSREPRTDRVAHAPSPSRAAADPAARYARCLDLLRKGDWTRAESGVQALMRSRPEFVPAHLLLAGIHAHLGRYAEGRALAEYVLRLDPVQPKAHLLLGMIAARAGRQDEAIAALGCALHLDDSLALAYFWLGNLHRDRGEAARACDMYAEAVTRYEQRRLTFTEEFAADLHPAQIVDYCRQSARRLRSAG